MIHEMTKSPERFQIDQLLNEAAFPHPVSEMRLLETHISWIILTGEFAYKIKKPVSFDFVDYSTLEQRKINCQKEVELNSRYCPAIYLDVVPIFLKREQLTVGECFADSHQESPVEFAVKMREFSQQSILAQLLRDSKLSPERMEQFAATVAEFHRQEPPVPVGDLEREAEKLHAEVKDNFDVLQPSLSGTAQAATLESISAWTEKTYQRILPGIKDRIQNGFLKSCHGDLHLNNIILFEDKLVPFDGIEFNPHLQTIDTLNEVAFLFMDLMAHGHGAHAWRFLNTYLELEGGYESLDVFRFFSVYRAMVRAKVAWINCQSCAASTHNPSWVKERSADEEPGDKKRREPAHAWDHYLEFAEKVVTENKPTLTITFGFSGSGKSTKALQQVEKDGGIRIRSDVLRMQLKNKDLSAPLYSDTTSDQVYRDLRDQSRLILNAGFSVVADATFLSRKHRKWFRELASELNIDFQILACQADTEVLRSRIKSRANDPSEATVQVLQKQVENHDPLDAQEQSLIVSSE